MAGRLLVYADGASRGNPGPAAIGAVLKDENGNTVMEISRYIGVATNNQAEYQGLIAGLQAAKKRGAESVQANLDSELVVKHITGEYRAKNPHLRLLLGEVRGLLGGFREFKVVYVPRQKNEDAHMLAEGAFPPTKP